MPVALDGPVMPVALDGPVLLVVLDGPMMLMPFDRLRDRGRDQGPESRSPSLSKCG
ncbi:hypothetical protein SAMN06295909_2540 [Plantibacter sp. VKM Ac-1784]|uniref:Uncharacterized protein n=1 Tax=Plantibacter elymi (nom. nud.) TaxID=199708 RepID=A0ABY1RGA1_9MICO|nr:hypothetical protein SAMN06295909_2540 [Plantibacter sp. VKM Ac-1784]